MNHNLRFIGVDPSLSRTGVGIIDVGRGEITTLSIPTSRKDDDYTRQLQALEQILDVLHLYDIVVLEDFGLASRYSQSGKSCERQQLLGMLMISIPKKTELPFLWCPPNFHKALIAGKASTHKEDARKALEEIWGVETKNNDESDAMAMAFAGKLACLPKELDKKRLSFVEKFKHYKQNWEALQKANFYHGFF